MQQLISVLMSTYKEPIEWIVMSINSILEQTYKNIELIVVIDNPDNNELIDYLTELQKKDKRVKIVKNKENKGLVYSLNRGFTFCEGEFIARMDADDVSELERLEMQYKYITETKYDLVGSGLQFFWENEQMQVVEVKTDNQSCLEMLRKACCSPHPTWLFRREVFEILKGYRDIDSCEDLDFLHRAAQRGFKLGNINKVLLQYRNNPESISHLKADKQRTTRYYLTKQFRKKHPVVYEEYVNYIHSDEYKCDLKQVELINYWESYIDKNKSSTVKKILGVIHLLSKRLYLVEIKEKIRGKVRGIKLERKEL